MLTAEQVYDMALKKGIKDPAVLMLGEGCVIGEWVPLSELQDDHILSTGKKGVRVLGIGETWGEAADIAFCDECKEGKSCSA